MPHPEVGARPRGRPRKFGRPSHAVTLTLPDDVIDALRTLDEDVSRAVVRVSQPVVAKAPHQAPAELAAYGQSAVIVTRPIAELERIAGVALVPLPDGRALISLDETVSVYEFELRLRDVLDDAKATGTSEAALRTLAAIIEILARARKTRGVRVERRGIIVLRSPRRRISEIL